MVLTRTEARNVFDHLLDNVLNRYGSVDLKVALTQEGYEDVFLLLSLDDATIESLEYMDPDDSTKKVSIKKSDKGLLKTFRAFVNHRNVTGNPIKDEDWMKLTQTEFDDFRIDPANLPSSIASPTSALTSAPARNTSTASTNKYTMVELFRRGIKRDPSLFPTLKDEKFNDSWHRSFETQARAQDVYNVLDSAYKPNTPEEKELFIEQQKYVYAVLESKVLTDIGKSLVREHEKDFDAQAVYSKLQAHHLKSTKAMINSSTILSYITSVRLGNGEWKGSTETFILNWLNQVRLYERQVPLTDHFSDGQKRVMLENAVHDISELRQVKNNADLEKTKTGQVLSFDQYTSLLLSAASALDTQYTTKRVKHQVFQHELFNNVDDEVPGDSYDSFDIETPVSTLQAYAAMHNKAKSTRYSMMEQKPRMSKDKWYALSESDKKLWDQFDDKAKSIILGIDTPKPHPGMANFQKVPVGQLPQRKVNLHEISAYDFLKANVHELSQPETQEESLDLAENQAGPDGNEDSSETILINAAKTSTPKLPPGDIKRVMSKTSTRLAHMAHITYNAAASKISNGCAMSLVDRGANGGVAGQDVRVLFKTNRVVDIRGIDNHQLTNIDIGTVGGVVDTQKGAVIAIMHQFALLGKGSTIHAPCQIEYFKNQVDDKSVHIGGSQCITTVDGYAIPLIIKDGLARLKIRPYTDQEFESLPHVFLTGESTWDPSVMDSDFSDNEQWYDALDIDPDPNTPRFDEFGNYRHLVTVQHATYFERSFSNSSHKDDPDIENVIDHCTYDAHSSTTHNMDNSTTFYDAYEHHLDDDEQFDPDTFSLKLDPRTVAYKAPDYSLLRPYFGWFSTDIIKQTFEHTTQYARLPSGTLLKRSFKSSNPALNVTRRNEAVACDIVYSDVPAIDNGSTAAVIFTGLDTQVTDVYGIKTDKQFINTLEDNIRYRGAPHQLISDRAQVEISKKVLDILRTLCISDWQSEPHQQQQNPAERRFQTVKTAANRIMDRTGAPPYTWLLCLTYVCFLLNHTYNSSIDGVPLQKLHGSTVDISVLLKFFFWQKVLYKKVDSGFPSESTEAIGHIVGISEHCGHALTWKILTADTQRIIYRSLVRPYSDQDPNLRAVMTGGETDDADVVPIIKSNHDTTADPTPPPIFNPEELIGRSFLMGKNSNGEVIRAKIVKMLDDYESNIKDNPTMVKFRLSINNDAAEEVVTYNQLLEYLAKDDENDVVWKFRRIVSHQGPLQSGHPDYKGSKYNVMVEWETGERTSEPLQLIATDDPVTCAIYARDNGLLELPGWKRFKPLAKRQKSFTRTVNQAKLKSYTCSPKYKFGFEVPKNYAHAMHLDGKNKNTKWKDAADLEVQQIFEYNTFVDHGHHTKSKAPEGYKKIRVHFVFDVKHDGRHKGRLVADGHLTDIPVDSVYSGVVSLRGFRMVLFLGELNGLEVWSTDIGNAYLEAMTSEKVYIIAGPEFGDLEGHILVINKALYGLRSSGARWHDKFADCLRELGFQQCKAEPDIWIRENNGTYEYIAVYVDDLAIAMKNPQEFIQVLTDRYKFKLKGTGPIDVHLGMTFHRDQEGNLCISSANYVEKMIGTYEKYFGEKPKQNVMSPLEKGDHPELDDSELLDSQGITLYQSLIGALQWAVSIGRFDIHTAVMTLSGFRVAPRRGHLDRVKRVYAYLSKMKHANIRLRTEEPDYSDIPQFNYDWSQTVYGNVKECKPHDAPKPLGKYVTLTHYVDANLMHDVTTGRSVTGVLHLINKTPIDWYSKKQATVETATYGSEFVAAKTCVEQIIDLRTLLYYLGVPVRESSYMFGDNKSVVDSSTQVHAKLHKRHNILSFHKVREAIASGMVIYSFINGAINPADILSKHWGYSQIWSQLKPLLFWFGDTSDSDTPFD
jgi:Reverse transcriptase (RNA-dependent DNA polymerase)